MTSLPRDLFDAARAARDNAHAPYSGFKVGAALRGESGLISAGCNVENAAYPHGQCAEASALGALVTAGAKRITEIVVLAGETGDGILCTPCGGCRQRLSEFAGSDVPVHICGPEGLRRTFTLGQLLPFQFGPDTLGV
jgi:cytidine deaminase